MATIVRNPGSIDLGNASYWVGGVAPTDGDVGVIGSGKDSFSTFTGMSAKDYLGLRFEAGYGDEATRIGSSGTPLTCSIDRTSAGVFTFAGRCAECWVAGGTWATIVWAPINPSAKLYLGSITNSVELYILNGIVEASANADLTVTNQHGGSLLVRAHASDAPTFNFYGGVCELQRDYATINQYADARLIHDLAHPDVASPAAGGTINLRGSPSGRLVLKSGDLATLNAEGGVVDKGSLRRALTITTANYWPRTLEVIEGGAAFVTESSTVEKSGLRHPKTKVG